MGYTFLENENLPEVMRVKNKWASCLVITTGFLVMTMSAIIIGTIFGYTYCYLERRCIKTNSHTHSSSFQTVVLRPVSESTRDNDSNNESLMSSVFVSRIMKINHVLLNVTASFQPTCKPDSNDTAVVN